MDDTKKERLTRDSFIETPDSDAFLLAIAVLNAAHQQALQNGVCPACVFGSIASLLGNMPEEVIEALHNQEGPEALADVRANPLLRAEEVTDFETEGNA